MRRKRFVAVILAASYLVAALCVRAQTRTFTNPLVRSQDAPDPWMVYHAGFYYFTATLDPEGGIWLWKTPTLAGLDSGERIKVHTPDDTRRAKQIWAPELHFINDRWYIYYTASDGVDENHRLYVLESRGRNPEGPYTFKARVFDPTADGWALDPSVFRAADGKLYLLWVAHVPGNGNGIRIAPLANPWTVGGASRLIAQADYAWERVRYPINEGPVALRHEGKTFLIYSASDTGTPDYALGMLTLTGSDVINPAAWRKSPLPVFKQRASADGSVYGPGHNGFFRSPDGTQDWIIYHAKTTSAYTYAGRTTRAQPFAWNADGTPNFGAPVTARETIAAPSGEGAGRSTALTLLAQPDSDDALALDSVSMTRSPFSFTSDHNFAADRRTRVMLFLANAGSPAGADASALRTLIEDPAGNSYDLPVEYAAPLGDTDLTQIVVRLPDDLADAAGARVAVTLRGEISNRVYLALRTAP